MILHNDVPLSDRSDDNFRFQVRQRLIRRNQTRLTAGDVLSLASEFGDDSGYAIDVIGSFGQWIIVKGEEVHNVSLDEFGIEISDIKSVDYPFGEFLAFEALGNNESGWIAYLVVGEKVGVFMDQKDGDTYAKEWIESVYDEYKSTHPFLDYTDHNLALVDHIVDGGMISLWNGERIIAQATIVRTPMNWTQVTLNRPEQHEVFLDVN